MAVGPLQGRVSATQEIERLVIEAAENVQAVLIDAVAIAFAHVVAAGAFAAEPPALLIDRDFVFVGPARLFGHIERGGKGADPTAKHRDPLFRHGYRSPILRQVRVLIGYASGRNAKAWSMRGFGNGRKNGAQAFGLGCHITGVV